MADINTLSAKKMREKNFPPVNVYNRGFAHILVSIRF